jgi:flagellar biosynthesis protein FliQ
MHLLYALGMLNAVGIIMGQILEMLPRATREQSAGPVAKLVYFLSCLAILAPWMVTICYFLVEVCELHATARHQRHLPAS